MDDETRDEEELDHKYTIMTEQDYGYDKPPFLNTIIGMKFLHL